MMVREDAAHGCPTRRKTGAPSRSIDVSRRQRQVPEVKRTSAHGDALGISSPFAATHNGELQWVHAMRANMVRRASTGRCQPQERHSPEPTGTLLVPSSSGRPGEVVERPIESINAALCLATSTALLDRSSARSCRSSAAVTLDAKKERHDCPVPVSLQLGGPI